jgi:hypothetical protein
MEAARWMLLVKGCHLGHTVTAAYCRRGSLDIPAGEPCREK